MAQQKWLPANSRLPAPSPALRPCSSQRFGFGNSSIASASKDQNTDLHSLCAERVWNPLNQNESKQKRRQRTTCPLGRALCSGSRTTSNWAITLLTRLDLHVNFL